MAGFTIGGRQEYYVTTPKLYNTGSFYGWGFFESDHENLKSCDIIGISLFSFDTVCPMCGIACVHGPIKNKSSIIEKSLSKITHRGSSIFEYKLSPTVALGANRLPIQGRTTGRQPLHNEDGAIWAIHNGEIFNYPQLRESLEKLGHIFTTDCDTEILCHLYEEYGADAIKHIDSEMFAFVVYDANSDSIYAGRDPLGVKPLYYCYHRDGSIHFASEAKQLVQFEDVDGVHNFPKGHYYFQGKFVAYKQFSLSNSSVDFNSAYNTLTRLLVAAVKKRVCTDLPIGVFLSGGVDSSLVMEIANRLHPDVTALIVGQPGASDYDYAVTLCKEYGYKHQIINSHIPTIDDIATIAYYTESYEPLINRISISNDFASKLAQQLGISVVLCGEGADELFGGYNEFSALKDDVINQGSLVLTDGLERGHLLRVDRLSMRHTVEVRSPFLDSAIVDFALSLPGSFKIYKHQHNIITKYLLRKVAAQFLPEYIVWRYKVPFHTGAGIDVGYNYKRDRRQEETFLKNMISPPNKAICKAHKLETIEEQWNFSIYAGYGYDKIVGNDSRIIVKDTLKTLNQSSITSFLVAEFDYIPLYFPLYYAQSRGIFSQHGLDVEFISTKGDDTTHASICNNSADIGLSDPLFSMMTVGNPIHSRIFAQLVTGVPVVAVSFDPSISITDIADFQNYTIGSYQQYSTTHTFACYATQHDVLPLSNDIKQLSQALSGGTIDIAIVLLEDAYTLESLGGSIIYNFSHSNKHFLYTGLTTTNLLDSQQQSKLTSFVVSIKEAIVHITRNKQEAVCIAQELFPQHIALDRTINSYLSFWQKDLVLNEYDAQQSYQMWKRNYPELMKKFNGSFFLADPIQGLIDSLCSRKFMRDYPFGEDALYDLIRTSLKNNSELHLVGFRGIGGVPRATTHDRSTIIFFHKFCLHISKHYAPGVKATFILSDMHALINGFSDFDCYLTDIGTLIEQQGYNYILLSSLYKHYHTTLDDIPIISEGERTTLSVHPKLEAQARKHYQGDDPILGAKRYYAARKLERSMIEDSFPDSIFFAHSASDMQILYPAIPTFYLRSTSTKQSPAPWFSS